MWHNKERSRLLLAFANCQLLGLTLFHWSLEYVEHPLRGWELNAVCSGGVALGYAEIAFQATITALTRGKNGSVR